MQLKRKYKQFGPRTDTEISGIWRDKDGIDYIKRKDGSFIPKQTTIPLNESIRRLLERFKEKLGLANYSELILQLLLVHKKARNLSKYLMKKAEHDIELQRTAREKAINKHRYKRRKPVEPDGWIL